MSELPTCFLDLPHDAVRLILASLDTWTTAVDDLNFLRWWNAMKLCCVSLYSICKAYEPQLCKAARIARRANLILTPNDRRWHYGYHEILPYCKMDPKPEQMTKIPEKLLEQSDFLRTCRMVRLDGAGLPNPSHLRWMLWNLYSFRNLQTLQLSRPEGRLDMMLPVLNEWLGAVAASTQRDPYPLTRLSLCRWPGIDFKAVAGLLECTCSLTSLDLIECELGDDALLAHIGPVVGRKLNPSSLDLYLDGNPITDDGLMQALGEGWPMLNDLSLSSCPELTTGLHARLLEVRLSHLPNLSHIGLFDMAVTPKDAMAYLERGVNVFAPQVGKQYVPAPFVDATVHIPGLGGWEFGCVEDFGLRKYERLYLWDDHSDD